VLDPQSKAFLALLAAGARPPLQDLSVPEARAASDALMLMTAGTPREVASTSDREIPGPNGPIHVRIYTPHGMGPFGVLVYLHGGGYVVGSVKGYDAVTRLLCDEAGCIVVSVDYRLAPEFKAPGPFEDAYAALQWTIANAASFGGDPKRVAIGGDSAGANLSIQCTLAARDRAEPAPVFAVLVYPPTDRAGDSASFKEFADQELFLTRAVMQWFGQNYFAKAGDASAGYNAPLHVASLAGLPPTLVIVAEYDPLRDEGIAYAERLRAEGVPVRLVQYDGMLHGFFGFLAAFDKGRAAVAEAAATLREAFSGDIAAATAGAAELVRA
jgi:acetyl esterase